ncbi:hypothetical protein J4E80_008970 [Alternaria sp. BMP 0032]|nr:hypothetical protein J4E80_008970 [Alternaria sp. BMP 0032]
MPALLSTGAMPEEEHNSDEVLGDAEGGEENYDAFETPAAETYAHLPKPIRDNIHFCIQAIETSHSEYQDTIKTIHAAFDAQKVSLDEQHARAIAQEAAFEKREALYIRLPTNQAVNLVHNALLAEHAHERVLVADMFKAVKIGKADMRAARADGLTKAKEVCLRQRKTLSKLIEGLTTSESMYEVEGIKSRRQLIADKKAWKTNHELVSSHGDNYNARANLSNSLTSYPDFLRPYFTRIEGDMGKELFLLNESNKHLEAEQTRIEREHKERKNEAYERCAEDREWQDRQLQSLRSLAKTAGISLHY